jgi:hypothetical protein
MKSLAWMYIGSTLAGIVLWAFTMAAVVNFVGCGVRVHAQTVDVRGGSASPSPTPNMLHVMDWRNVDAVTKVERPEIDWSVFDAGWGSLRMPQAMGKWQQPKTPDEVEVEIKTTDGKHWIARWVPKP